MFPTDKKLKLVSIYFYVCDIYENNLKYICERFSYNNTPAFTDQEALTIYLFSMNVEERHKVKQIYNFANDYLQDWFPKLPSYEAFTNRINRLCCAFQQLAMILLSCFVPKDCQKHINLVDSLPIITCSHKRSPKVATEIINKGFCSTKNMHYYGLKLHALCYRRDGHLPFPEFLQITPAAENDLTALKNFAYNVHNRQIFGDKIYGNKEFWNNMRTKQNVQMLTPVKNVKGQTEEQKQRNKAFNDLYSTAVSKIRQPIESLFNWLIEKTDIQTASKVRSTKGLITFIFGRIAAAFISLIF